MKSQVLLQSEIISSSWENGDSISYLCHSLKTDNLWHVENRFAYLAS